MLYKLIQLFLKEVPSPNRLQGYVATEVYL